MRIPLLAPMVGSCFIWSFWPGLPDLQLALHGCARPAGAVHGRGFFAERAARRKGVCTMCTSAWFGGGPGRSGKDAGKNGTTPGADLRAWRWLGPCGRRAEVGGPCFFRAAGRVARFCLGIAGDFKPKNETKRKAQTAGRAWAARPMGTIELRVTS